MRAFTLIETLVYIALCGLLLSGTVAAVAGMRAAAARLATQALLLEDGPFLLETLDHALSNGSTPSSFRLSNSFLMQGTDTLSGNQVRVRNLSLLQTAKTVTEPTYIDLSFLLSANTDTGILLEHAFTERVYVVSP
jgi:type II secretory pathway pseudopilin PulG